MIFSNNIEVYLFFFYICIVFVHAQESDMIWFYEFERKIFG